jgi:ligand-binding sensor domain-containing protein
MDSLPDIMSAIVDQSTGKIIAGSYGGGMVDIAADGKITMFKQGSALSAAAGNPADYRVLGLAFDLDRQLWVTNPGTQQPLLIRKKDGTWKKFSIPFPNATHPGLIAVDLDNRKWIILQGGGGLVCLDDNGTPDQLNDDRWRLFRQGRGNGNLPSSNVTAISADKNGFIWVGTDRGVAIIQCNDDLFNPAACEATLPVVRQDNFAGLLLAEENISDIETDQADRKWITSNNGVWLISADGQKTIHRFTSSNSKLLSDQVLSVAINDQTGEVFFLTDAGISSFRGEATAPASSKRKPFVFPNPVPPGYSGTIAFRDLPDRAWVKITELNGKLVFETRSLGGQAVWNGRNIQGTRVSSGVYLIYVSEEFNQYQVAGKVVFIK